MSGRMESEEQDLLAAEFAMGTLEGDVLERAERLVAEDPAFARDVEAWRQRLGALDRTAAPEKADDALWKRIEQSLDGSDGAHAEAEAHKPAPTAAANQNFWKRCAIGGLAASLLLTAGLVTAVATRPEEPLYVAVLLADDRRPGALIQIYEDQEVKLVPLQEFTIPPERVLQVWTLPTPQSAPVSIGLLSQARSVRLNLSDLPSPASNQFFEITLEPAGGSPTGRPTGPILYKGNAAETF
jgi:anti-sigma-K factor RskA